MYTISFVLFDAGQEKGGEISSLLAGSLYKPGEDIPDGLSVFGKIQQPILPINGEQPMFGEFQLVNLKIEAAIKGLEGITEGKHTFSSEEQSQGPQIQPPSGGFDAAARQAHHGNDGPSI